MRETPVFDFMKGYYESILGEEIADEEILSWLTSPWRLNQRIRPLTEEISFIRIALTEIAKSA